MTIPEISIVISAISMSVALGTFTRTWLRETRVTRRADVTAYLHRTSDFAKVRLPSGEERRAGYHLVLANRGPAAARDLRLSIANAHSHPVSLLDVANDEFPLELDAAAEYPIPLLLSDGSESSQRRYHIKLTWRDNSGDREHTIWLRRGQLPRSAS